MRISENRLNRIIKETIDNAIEFGDFEPSRGFGGGNVDSFTPYSKEERERNFKGVGGMGNPSYDKFKAWRKEKLRNGVPRTELGWNAYLKAMGK